MPSTELPFPTPSFASKSDIEFTMPSLFQKLNLKNQTAIVVINSPQSFEPELANLEKIAIFRDLKKVTAIEFALAFATRKSDVDSLSKSLAGKAVRDAVLWFAYPKATSKKFTCDFKRDSGWDVIRKLGFDSVRMVAIDEDWSALRFRRLEFIGKQTDRSSAG